MRACVCVCVSLQLIAQLTEVEESEAEGEDDNGEGSTALCQHNVGSAAALRAKALRHAAIGSIADGNDGAHTWMLDSRHMSRLAVVLSF